MSLAKVNVGRLLVGGLVLMIPAVAAATQIHFRDVTLPDALSGADLVVEVESLGTQDALGRPERLRVVDVHFTSARVASPTGEIDVFDRATLAGARSVAVSRASGVRRSPLVSRLRGGLEPESGHRYCVILSRTHEHALSSEAIWSTAVSRAYVDAPCDELRRLARGL